MLASGMVGAAQSTPVDPVTRLGEYVQDYYSKARSIVADETVWDGPILISSFEAVERLQRPRLCRCSADGQRTRDRCCQSCRPND
jgi:hypothetical protein